jgi:hypothetical protein
MRLDMDHIPRVGERIMLPKASKIYEVIDVMYCTKLGYSVPAFSYYTLSHIQLKLKNLPVNEW